MTRPATDQLDNLHPGLAAGWHPLARAHELGDAPTELWLMGRPLVLARLGQHLLLAPDSCPHRGVPLHLGQVTDSALQCAYHGWRFGADGRCAAVPSLRAGVPTPPAARLHTFQVIEADGVLWGSVQQLDHEPPTFPTLGAAGFDTLHLPARTVAAPAARVVENFLDTTHFAFLHRGTFGTSDPADTGTGELESCNDGGFVHHVEETFANREDPGVAAGERPLLQRRRLEYRFSPPLTASLTIDWLDVGVTKVLFLTVAPSDAASSVVFQSMSRNDIDGDAAAAEQAVRFENRVFDEDLLVLEAARWRGLPLDDRSEVHVRGDRPTLELRRHLRRWLAAADPS